MLLTILRHRALRLPDSLSRQRAVTVAILVLGYAGYYLCRSDFSVALPLIIAELGSHGVPTGVATIQMGSIASLGVLAYALGKFPSGGAADFLGGKRNFLLGMSGSVVFTVLFALAGGLPIFTLAWIGNRLVQSMGWAGVVKVTSKWFSYTTYGTAMGVISLSFLFGDAASRQFMGFLLGHGVGWRGVFLIAGGALALLAVLTLLLLKESPGDAGCPEPVINPLNIFNEEGGKHKPASLTRLLKPLLGSGVLWLVPALFGIHDCPRDIQHLDSNLLHPGGRIEWRGRRRQKRVVSPIWRNLGGVRRSLE